jgi:hypothetical protein
MRFIHFLQSNIIFFQKLLKELSKKKKDQIKSIEDKLKKIISDLVDLQSNNSFL